MVDKKQLEEIYKQNLENDIINAISKMKGIDLRKAFDIYYSSKLAEQISNDSYGIENMDAKEITHPLSKSLQGCSSNISIPARLIEEIISYSAPKYCASKKQKNMTAARKTELPNPVITA